MKINQFYKTFIVIINLVVMNFFFIQGVYAEDISSDTMVVKYSGRSITERHYVTTDNNLYIYSVADLNEKIEKIKKAKMPFDYCANSAYPKWNDYLLFNKECKEYVQLVRSYFSKNKKGISPTEILLSFYVMLNDDGSTICKQINSEVNLFDMFSTKEILDIFDKIGTYKFTTPVVSSPSKGYCVLPLMIR